MNRPKLVDILALGLSLSGAMKATLLLPTYTPIACGGQGQVACSVTPTGVTPTAAQLQGLTPSLAAVYFSSQNIKNVNPASLLLTPGFANSNGYVVGQAFDLAINMDVQFIYHAGQVTCCITDFPFHLTDINDQNIVVGGLTGALAPPFIGDASIMNADQNGLTLTFTDPTFSQHHLIGSYLAIDNQNRILFQEVNGQEWILDPATVPEPSSVFLLLTVVGGIAFTMRRRLFHPTT